MRNIMIGGTIVSRGKMLRKYLVKKSEVIGSTLKSLWKFIIPFIEEFLRDRKVVLEVSPVESPKIL